MLELTTKSDNRIQNIEMFVAVKLVLLNWYYAQFSVNKLRCNCYLFQKISIYNEESQINDNVIC